MTINSTMPDSKKLLDYLYAKIQLKESRDEILSILYLLLHHVTGLTRSDILSGKETGLVDFPELDRAIRRINRSEPIQYIIGESEFYGRTFSVNRSVLIPRPETEQLVDEVLRLVSPSDTGILLDIGTGSGCLAVTLAKVLPKYAVVATDVSQHALDTAEVNAAKHGASVSFHNHNILEEDPPVPLASIIVSNPPYITPSEKDSMNDNVLLFEPHLALFVPENRPLIFYEAIVAAANKILIPEGVVVLEINEMFGIQVADLFVRGGFRHAEIKVDINGKDRILIARR